MERTAAGGSPQAQSLPVRRHARTGRRDARLERLIVSEIVPRLMLSHRAPSPPSTPVPAVPRPLTDADVASFVDAVRSPDDAAALDIVRTLVAAGTPVETIYLDLLAPSARRLGELWEDDECDFVAVTVALGRIQRLLREVSQLFLADTAPGRPTGRILLSCLPGEQHTLGLIMVGEFLLRDGWRVVVGAPWAEEDLLELVGSEWFDVIGFSVGCESRLSVLKREVHRVRGVSRNPRLQVLVGGQVFARDDALAGRVGADGVAGDAREAPRTAATLLAAARAHAPLGTAPEAPGPLGQFRESV